MNTTMKIPPVKPGHPQPHSSGPGFFSRLKRKFLSWLRREDLLRNNNVIEDRILELGALVKDFRRSIDDHVTGLHQRVRGIEEMVKQPLIQIKHQDREEDETQRMLKDLRQEVESLKLRQVEVNLKVTSLMDKIEKRWAQKKGL